MTKKENQRLEGTDEHHPVPANFALYGPICPDFREVSEKHRRGHLGGFLTEFRGKKMESLTYNSWPIPGRGFLSRIKAGGRIAPSRRTTSPRNAGRGASPRWSEFRRFAVTGGCNQKNTGKNRMVSHPAEWLCQVIFRRKGIFR